MGWEDRHLHEFRLLDDAGHRTIGILGTRGTTLSPALAEDGHSLTVFDLARTGPCLLGLLGKAR